MKQASVILALFFSILGLSAQSLPPVTYEEAVLSDKPIAYWKLTDTEKVIAKDRVGTYSGIYHNVDSAKHLSPFLKDEKAAVFHQNGYISIVGQAHEKTPNAFKYDMFRNVTFEVWINPNLIENIGHQVIFSKKGDYAFGLYTFKSTTLYPDGTQSVRRTFFPAYYFSKDANNWDHNCASYVEQKQGEWFHIAFVLNSSGPNEIYLNGVCILTENGEKKGFCETPDYSDNISLRIGGLLYHTGKILNPFQGMISHVALYDRPLSLNVIEKHYFAGLAERAQVLNSGKKDEILTLESIALREQALIQKEKALKAKEEDLLELEKKLRAEQERLKALSENKK